MRFHRTFSSLRAAQFATLAGILLLAVNQARASFTFNMFDQATSTSLGSIEVGTAGAFFSSDIVAFDFTDPTFGINFDENDNLAAFGSVDGINDTITINLSAETANFDFLEFNLPTPNQAEWSLFPDSGGFAEGIVFFQFVPEPGTSVMVWVSIAVGLTRRYSRLVAGMKYPSPQC